MASHPFQDNLRALRERYPAIAERLESWPDRCNVRVFAAADGGTAYGLRRNGRLVPVRDTVSSLRRMQLQFSEKSIKLQDSTRPVLLVGLYPGSELSYIFNISEHNPRPHVPQQILVCIDSLTCLQGFLQTFDARHIIRSPRVRFFWHEDTARETESIRNQPGRSHLFTFVTGCTNGTPDKVMPHFVRLVEERRAETKRLQNENNAYYDAITDSRLADIIKGNAGRAPRLMLPTSSCSTVTQYSARDTAAAFDKAGWNVKRLNMDTMLTPYYIAAAVNDFKPDVFLFINHLRTEATEAYPRNMMFVTWVQDTSPLINNRNTARTWNVVAGKRRRDLLIGYVGQLRPYDYLTDRLAEMPMIVNADIFKPMELTASERKRYDCDVMFASNSGAPTRERLDELRNEFADRLSLDCPMPLLAAVNDHLWREYRAGRTFTNYVALRRELTKLDTFRQWFSDLPADDRDYFMQRIFWRLNDVIYRQIVVDWLVEYSRSHPDFRLHLYGKGWERNPEFARFHKGVLTHGRRLSIAYQAARSCLHLNSMGLSHQRLAEILACGAVPLIRVRTEQQPPRNEPGHAKDGPPPAVSALLWPGGDSMADGTCDGRDDDRYLRAFIEAATDSEAPGVDSLLQRLLAEEFSARARATYHACFGGASLFFTSEPGLRRVLDGLGSAGIKPGTAMLPGSGPLSIPRVAITNTVRVLCGNDRVLNPIYRITDRAGIDPAALLKLGREMQRMHTAASAPRTGARSIVRALVRACLPGDSTDSAAKDQGYAKDTVALSRRLYGDNARTALLLLSAAWELMQYGASRPAQVFAAGAKDLLTSRLHADITTPGRIRAVRMLTGSHASHDRSHRAVESMQRAVRKASLCVSDPWQLPADQATACAVLLSAIVEETLSAMPSIVAGHTGLDDAIAYHVGQLLNTTARRTACPRPAQSLPFPGSTTFEHEQSRLVVEPGAFECGAATAFAGSLLSLAGVPRAVLACEKTDDTETILDGCRALADTGSTNIMLYCNGCAPDPSVIEQVNSIFISNCGRNSVQASDFHQPARTPAKPSILADEWNGAAPSDQVVDSWQRWNDLGFSVSLVPSAPDAAPHCFAALCRALADKPFLIHAPWTIVPQPCKRSRRSVRLRADGAVSACWDRNCTMPTHPADARSLPRFLNCTAAREFRADALARDPGCRPAVCRECIFACWIGDGHTASEWLAALAQSEAKKP